ncbi:MAG TPA: hypothetical protein VJ857_05305 [Methanocorpusculum sp.]|nr:hypothetical protein [Methanocorpusculum sp.]HKL98065.1 hypothetical protein [Methanocorpusculum sp.]
MFEKDEFITRIEHQIRVEEEYTKMLEDGKHRLSRSKYLILIPLALLLIVVVVFSISSGTPGRVLMLWVEGSFYLYMFYFFLMMLPSIGSDAKINIFDKKFRVYVMEFLRLANILRTVRKNPLTLVEFFWNAFLINTKPLVKGFTILYISDLICAVIMKILGIIDWTLFLLLVVQIGVILIFYSRVTAAKPGTPGFFTGKPLSEQNTNGVAGLKAWLYVGLFSMFTGLIIVGAMFFPSMTIGEFLHDISLVPGEYPLIFTLILITQGLTLRYFQGIESRKLMNILNERHLTVLRNDLLPRVNLAAPDHLSELKREFLLFIMNKLMVQEFFYRFPAYILMPNLLLALDPVAQEILMESGEDKHLKDML